MRVVFFATTGFGEPALMNLAGNHEVPLVVTVPDAPTGRGLKLTPPPIKNVAGELGIRVLQPEKLKDPAFVDELRSIGADLFFVVAFRILPREVFSLAPKGTVNLHASLLPDLRGAAPINWAIIYGYERTGLTTFFITERVDAGDILLQEEVSIGPDETARELEARMKVIGGTLSLKTVNLIEKGFLAPSPQAAGTVRPAPKLFRNDRVIDWNVDARAVHNRVRGLSPDPGAFVECRGGPVRILRTQLLNETAPGSPGTVIACSGKEGMIVSCARGSVRIVDMQPPGKKMLTSACFLRGHPVAAGMKITDIC